MFEILGLGVIDLKRVRMGNIELEDLEEGDFINFSLKRI
jgi:16S rRNA U516 pseudouridylate synthase RsuA-like enzyme